MYRQDTFRVSHKLYAVDLSTLRIEERTRQDGAPFYSGAITAVWFRRRRRGGYGPDGAVVTVACIGSLWDSQGERPSSGAEFLERHDDGRYGGSCAGRWDGSGYWGAEEPEVRDEHMRILRPMLENYPAIPDGFDGWWRF